MELNRTEQSGVLTFSSFPPHPLNQTQSQLLPKTNNILNISNHKMDTTLPEIWENIFCFLSLRDLRSCSRLNKQLSSEAIKIISKIGKVSLKSQDKLFNYMDYLNDGGRLHKNIRVHLTTTELASDEVKYSNILLKIQPSVEKCVLFTYVMKDFSILVDDPSIRLSDNLLHQVLNLCPKFCLVLEKSTCPEYILQYFLSTRLNFLRSIQFNCRKEELEKSRYDTLEKLVSSAVNLRQLLFFHSDPYPIEWPLTTLASLPGARLEKIKSIRMFVKHGEIPEILVDRRLSLKDITLAIRFSADKLEKFNEDVGKLLKHHAASLECLTLNNQNIKYPEEIANIQLPELPKLKELNLISRVNDSAECSPFFPSLPPNFPPFLKRIRIKMRFHAQNILERELKTLFRHQWLQPTTQFQQVKGIEISECKSDNPECMERVGPLILRKIIKMFPNAEIRIKDEKLNEKLVISRFGNREKWDESKQ